jgi:hypothetical protein
MIDKEPSSALHAVAIFIIFAAVIMLGGLAIFYASGHYRMAAFLVAAIVVGVGSWIFAMAVGGWRSSKAKSPDQ